MLQTVHFSAMHILQISCIYIIRRYDDACFCVTEGRTDHIITWLVDKYFILSLQKTI